MRTGLALHTTEGYAAVNSVRIEKPLIPDLTAWAPMTEWHLACVCRAAKVFGSTELPGEETIGAPADRPAPAPRNADEAIARYQAMRTCLLSALDCAVAARDHCRASPSGTTSRFLEPAESADCSTPGTRSGTRCHRLSSSGRHR